MASLLKLTTTCVPAHKGLYGYFSKRLLVTSNDPTNSYDVIIAGGGMIGTTLACTLGKNKRLSEKRILLLEGSKQKEYGATEKYSNRVSSLNPATIKLLKQINVWPHIEAVRYSVVNRMQVWDAISDTMITFDSNLNKKENLIAYIVENDVLLGAVAKELTHLSNVDILYEAKIKDYHLQEHNETDNKIHLENGNTYSCKLLIAQI